MEYCSSVWDPYVKQQASSLEMVQRRAARWATSRYHNTSSVTDMLHELRWRPLSQRRIDSRLSMAYKIVNGLVAVPLGCYLNLQRNNLHLQNIIARTNYYRFSYFPRTVCDWNLLPREILQSKSMAIFRNNIVTLTHPLPY